jgi:hypothetical protein
MPGVAPGDAHTGARIAHRKAGKTIATRGRGVGEWARQTSFF